MTIIEKLKIYDNLGTLLSVAALFCGTMAVNFGGTLYAWKSGQIIALFVVSGVLFIAFGLQQTFKFMTSFEGRILPVQLIPQKEPFLLFVLMAANNCASMIGMVSHLSEPPFPMPYRPEANRQQYYIPLIFQFIGGAGALNAGIRLLPFIIATTVFIALQGALLPAYPLYKPWYLIGAVCILIGGVLFEQVDTSTSDAYLYGVQVLLGVGVGCYLQAGFAVILGVIEMKDMAYGVTFILFAQLLGITVGLSVGGAVFTNTALRNLRPLLPDVPEGQLQEALSGAAGGFLKTLDEQTRMAILNVITVAINRAYVLISPTFRFFLA